MRSVFEEGEGGRSRRMWFNELKTGTNQLVRKLL